MCYTTYTYLIIQTLSDGNSPPPSLPLACSVVMAIVVMVTVVVVDHYGKTSGATIILRELRACTVLSGCQEEIVAVVKTAA